MSPAPNKLFLFLIFSILVAVSTKIYAQIDVFEFYDHTPPTHLGEHIEVFEDTANTFQIKDVAQMPFKKSDVATPNFDHTSSTIWVHFKIHNATNFTPFLRVNPEWFPEVWMYTFIKNELKDSAHFGAIYPKSERALHISAPNVPLHVVQNQEADIYLKLKSDHIIIFDLTVADDASHYENHTTDIVFYFIFMGVMLCVLIYNFVLSISSSRVGNYYFVLYIICLIINTSFVKGFHDFVHTPYLAIHSNIFSVLMVIFLAESIVFLTGLKNISKKLYYGRFIIIAPALVSLILNLLGEVRMANVIIINFAFLGAIWGLIVGARIIKSGEKGAITIFIAFFCFIAGGIVHLLSIKGLIPTNVFTVNAYVIGSGFQVVFFSFYLAGKLHNIRKERYLAQQRVLEEITKNEELVREQNEILERTVAQRTKQLKKQNQIIRENNKRITDGITYASYIQNAHLIPLDQLNPHCADSFILYRPKDILSGDFYFFAETTEHVFFIAADCTGHGVPGALLSITGHNILKEIILLEHLTNPADILDRLNEVFYQTLHQDQTSNRDGMDITLVVRNKRENTVVFAGAKNPIYYIEEGKLQLLKGDRISIGGENSRQLRFTSHEIHFRAPFTFYLFSDGYQDQFDAENLQKFRTERFRNLLQEIHHLPFSEQRTILNETLDSWKGKEPQTDDVLIMGIKLALV